VYARAAFIEAVVEARAANCGQSGKLGMHSNGPQIDPGS
jgi:hypothetical protein